MDIPLTDGTPPFVSLEIRQLGFALSPQTGGCEPDRGSALGERLPWEDHEADADHQNCHRVNAHGISSSVACGPLTRGEDLLEPALDRLARDRARIDQPHDTVDIDEYRRRHTPERIALANLALLVEQHRKGHLEVVPELAYILHPLLIRQVDRQHLQVLI